jgi:hypothetical protein
MLINAGKTETLSEHLQVSMLIMLDENFYPTKRVTLPENAFAKDSNPKSVKRLQKRKGLIPSSRFCIWNSCIKYLRYRERKASSVDTHVLRIK